MTSSSKRLRLMTQIKRRMKRRDAIRRIRKRWEGTLISSSKSMMTPVVTELLPPPEPGSYMVRERTKIVFGKVHKINSLNRIVLERINPVDWRIFGKYKVTDEHWAELIDQGMSFPMEWPEGFRRARSIMVYSSTDEVMSLGYEGAREKRQRREALKNSHARRYERPKRQNRLPRSKRRRRSASLGPAKRRRKV